MATTIFTPSMLRGAGTRGVPEVPAGSSYENTYSMDFDGIDDYVDLTQHNLGTTSTISLWIKPDATAIVTAKNYTILGENSYSFDYLLAIKFSTPNPRVFFRIAGGYLAWSSTPIANTNWHNIIIVRDTLTTAKLYLDGVDQGSPTASGGTFSGDTKFRYLCTNYPTNTQFFIGNIDEVSAFNSVLTTSQITTISSGPSDLTSLSPVAWYQFEEGSGTTAIDSGTGGNNGTINGATYSTDVPT